MAEDLEQNQSPSADEAARQAALSLTGLIRRNADAPILFLLSGGSALHILDFLDRQSLSVNVTVAVLDERFSTDPAVNNYLQIQKKEIFQNNKTCSFIDTVPEPKENMAQLADRLENSLRTWKELNPQGKIFATLGVGADGHLAGMLPFPEDPKLFADLFLGHKWTVAYNAGLKNPYPERITTTVSFLQQVDEGIVYITGENKKPVLNILLAKQKPIAELPAMGLYKIKHVTVFTDIK